MVLNLIFLGPPGAGKGTVAQAVADKFSLAQVSTGDLIRAEVASGSELAKELQEIMSSGGLVGDELVAKMLEAKLKALSEEEGFSGIIFDGFPRTIPQANELENILTRLEQKLDAVINIESSEENIVKRLSSRWTCSKCKQIYNTVTNPPKVEGVCDIDGEALFQREDDKPDTIRARLAQYNEKTAPLIEFYKEKELLKSYDGNVPPAESIAAAEKLIESIKEGQ
ncbi:MAG: adenylate kinase [Candidatus Diapherotrites archaeon]|jgi:adenylate kinase|uniref:Adenylate kinase n=1 Tax=Candidatus Iainarchaeum sp. TaxID=3101447 RepID=A0A8T5GEK6_9ARCH|nr:adenylate kinase [Candidatus Diapherotrites archaeon]MBT7241301.1 adenylate kinase [Candidatus Diapherotrites archaeon]